MIALITFQALVAGLLVLAGGIPKSPRKKAHLSIHITPVLMGCVDRKDRDNPLKNLLAVAVEHTLREQGIQPLYIVAGLAEVRVALSDVTLVYKTTPHLSLFLKAYNSRKAVSEIYSTLKLIEVKRDGIPPLRRILNLIPV